MSACPHICAWVVAVSVALLGVVPQNAVHADGSLLLNPGAEQGQGQQPSAWYAASVPAQGLRMWQDTEQARSGRASLAIANTHEYERSVSNNWAEELQAVPKGQVLRLTVWIRTRGAEAVNVCIQCWDLERRNLLAFGSTPVFRGDQDWVQARATPVLVPEQTESIIVRAALTGKGQVWFDDFEMTADKPSTAAQGSTRPGALTDHGSEDLAARVPGRLVESIPVKKDSMILAYIPDWGFDVDNLAVADNNGGVRALIDWPPIPPEVAQREDRRFVLAYYSRKTTLNEPVSRVQVCEILRTWPPSVSWKNQPGVANQPAAEYDFEPGTGWKLFDITPLLRAQVKGGRTSYGAMLRFARENRSGVQWSGYNLVSAEGAGEWAEFRPRLLVVDAPGGRQHRDRR